MTHKPTITVQRVAKGLQQVTWGNADGTTTLRYRVRVKRDGLNANKMFETKKAAEQFLALSKSTRGIEQIITLTAEEEASRKAVRDFIQSPPFQHWINTFAKAHATPAPDASDLDKRKLNNRMSILNTLAKTLVKKPPQQLLNPVFEQIRGTATAPLGMLKVEEIGIEQIDTYAKARRAAGRKATTIERELGVLSSIYYHLSRMPGFNGLQNPTSQLDKKLMARYRVEDAQAHQPKGRMRDEDVQTLMQALANYSNPDVLSIVMLSLATAMRRSEVVTLKWSQVNYKDRTLSLRRTKTGKPREVVLTDEALGILSAVEKRPEMDKIFSFNTVAGFEGSYRKILEAEDLKHLNFHRMRGEAFTRFFEGIGGGSATLLAKFLGVQNVGRFKQVHQPKKRSLHTEEGITAREVLNKSTEHARDALT